MRRFSEMTRSHAAPDVLGGWFSASYPLEESLSPRADLERNHAITDAKEAPQGLFARHFDLLIGYTALVIGILMGLPCFDECRDYGCLGCLIVIFITGGIGLGVCVAFSLFGIVRDKTIPTPRSGLRTLLLRLPFVLLVAAVLFGAFIFL